MKKITAFLFFCLILNFIYSNEIFVKPVAFVKIKIDSQIGSVISESIIKYYLICDSKEYNKIAVRFPFKNSSSTADMFKRDNDNLIKIKLGRSYSVYVYRNASDYTEITDYDSAVTTHFYMSDYKLSLKNREIDQKDFFNIKNTQNKEYITLIKDYNIDYIFDTPSADLIFQLIHPYKTTFFDKKEYKIFIDKTAE